MQDIELQLAGHITGTVTSQVGGAPIQDVRVTVYQRYDDEGDVWWDQVAGGYTAANGTYDVGGLATGTYRVRFSDESGAYLGEYYDDATSLGTATDVSVTAGSTTGNIDAALSTPGHISGTVTAQVGGAPIEDVWVTVYQRYDDEGDVWWDEIAGGPTAANGTYDVGCLATGTYRVRFSDESGAYLGEYYDDATSLGTATDVSVTAGSTTGNIDAALANAGHISGIVTAQVGGVPIGDVWVSAYQRYDDEGDVWWDEIAGGYTAANGTYDVGGLATGTCRIRFYDYSGAYLGEYYDNATSLGAATDVSVTAGSTTGNIDAALANAGHISGTVTAQVGGAPIEDVWVRAYQRHDEGGDVRWDEVAGGYTAASGTYSVGGLDTGTYRVRFYDESGAYLGEYYDDATSLWTATDVSVTAGSTTGNIDAALGPVVPPDNDDFGNATGISGASGTLEGSNQGATVEPREVRFSHGSSVWYRWVAPTTGLLVVDTLGSDFDTVLVVGQGESASAFTELAFNDDAAGLTSKVQLSVTQGQTYRIAVKGYYGNWGQFFLNWSQPGAAPGSLTGTVSSGGSPLAGVSVAVADKSTVTAANGAYVISDIAPGTYAATFSKTGHITQSPSVTIAAGSATTKDVSLAVAPGSLTGTVSSGGSPLAGVSVAVADKSTVTAANGAYVISDIAPGTYAATFSKTGHITQSPSVTIAAGSATTQHVSLKVPTTLVAGFGSATATHSEVIVGYGKTAVLVGALTDSLGTGLAQKAVVVERYDTVARVWVKYADAVAGTTAGEYRCIVKAYAASRTQLRMSFAGDTASEGSTSAVRTSMPRSYVSTPKAPKTMSRTKYYNVYGYLKPRHTSGTYPVRIYKWKRTSTGKWKSYGYVRAKASKYYSYSKYSAKIRLTSKGTWRLKAVAPKDGSHAASLYSGYDTVYVK
jgi:5-hydroxyisourate hydrolase-like protein (transthyretin family)